MSGGTQAPVFRETTTSLLTSDAGQLYKGVLWADKGNRYVVSMAISYALSTPDARLSENNVAIEASGRVGFWNQPLQNTDLLGYTPTLDEIYKQVIAARADIALSQIRISESLKDRFSSGYNQGNAVGLAMSDIPVIAEQKSPKLTGRLVPVPVAARTVSLCVMTICVFSLLIWTMSGFIIINPAVSIIVLVGSIFLTLVAQAEMASLKKKSAS